jgi:hypothetical protein
MPTVECKDCGTVVSTSAILCPKCGSPYPAANVQSKVIISKKKGFKGSAGVFKIFVDGEPLGSLFSSEKCSLILPIGEHQIAVFSGNVELGHITVNILPKKIYEIEYEFQVHWVSRATVTFKTSVREDK